MYRIFVERVKLKLSGQLFVFPSPCCKGGLSTLGREVLTQLLYMLRTRAVLSRLHLTACKHLDLHIANAPPQYTGLFL